MAWDTVEKEQFALGGGTPFVYRTIFITEYVARDLAKKYKDKNQLENALIETARRPLDERAYANFYANPGSSFDGKNYSLEQHKSKIAQEEKAQTTQTPKWLLWTGKTQLQTVPVIKSGKTAIVVTGDASRNKVLTVPGGGMTTVKIELPNNWDILMKDLGYKPLNSYFVKISPLVNIPQVQQTVQQNRQQQRTYKNNNSQTGNQRRPTAERYKEIRQERTQSSGEQYRNSTSNYHQRRSSNRSYGSYNSNRRRQPSEKQYRNVQQGN